MKTNKLIFAFAAFSAVFIFLLSCNKERSISLQEPSIIASKNNAAVGEGIDLSIANLPIGSLVEWASSPSANAVIESNGFSGENARAVFTVPGIYTIIAYLTTGNHSEDSLHHDEDSAFHHSEDSIYHHGEDSTYHHGEDSTYHHSEDSTYHHSEDSTYHHGEDSTHHYGEDTTHHHHDGDSTHSNDHESGFTDKISITITIHD